MKGGINNVTQKGARADKEDDRNVKEKVMGSQRRDFVYE